MTGQLPPLRFTGGTILRDGCLQHRSLAVADGHFTKGPLPEVDMSGYLLLPGIIDLYGRLPADLRGTEALHEADRRAAAAGIATQCLSQGWSWESVAESPLTAGLLAAAWAGLHPRLACDLRLQLRVEHALAPDTARLLDIVRRHGITQVMFSDRAGRARAMAEADPAGFARLAERLGRSPQSLEAGLEVLNGSRGAVPRALCLLAERFDRMGVIYGSVEDETGEAREHHSMIGATLCVTPATRRAAAAARAVGDPVILAASPLLAAAAAAEFPGIRADALVSDGRPADLAAAALRLADLGLLQLPEAWALISEGPARLLRLTDRGTLDLGRRADLTIVNARSRMVEATLVAGRLAFATGEAQRRFFGIEAGRRLAAE